MTEPGEDPAARAHDRRPLDRDEAALLDAIADRLPPVVRDGLRAQVRHAAVTGRCGCGCATVDLAVSPEVRPVALQSPIGLDVTIVDDADEPVGGVLVFLDGGRLSLLELYGFEEPILRCPPVERVRFAPA
ncbi:hypothetical protein [Patulibacter defluvii]|uniref:hypothetical protein n=1 Tax=Patulibacter defluvii TaxID=3095358 RepID=UPI002A74E796|nr:hypothetical protein [Patulibacter sp. DM4]